MGEDDVTDSFIATTHEVAVAAAIAGIDLGDAGVSLRVPSYELTDAAARAALAGLAARGQLRVIDSDVQLPGALLGLVDVMSNARERIAVLAETSAADVIGLQFIASGKASMVVEVEPGDLLVFAGLDSSTELARHAAAGITGLFASDRFRRVAVVTTGSNGSNGGASFIVEASANGTEYTIAHDDESQPTGVVARDELARACLRAFGSQDVRERRTSQLVSRPFPAPEPETA